MYFCRALPGQNIVGKTRIVILVNWSCDQYLPKIAVFARVSFQKGIFELSGESKFEFLKSSQSSPLWSFFWKFREIVDLGKVLLLHKRAKRNADEQNPKNLGSGLKVVCLVHFKKFPSVLKKLRETAVSSNYHTNLSAKSSGPASTNRHLKATASLHTPFGGRPCLS